MLIYLGTGERRYGDNPVYPNQRRSWEFQAVLRGKIGILGLQGPEVLRSSHLWIFPPRHTHGWVGEKKRSAQVAVFHFLSVPEILRQMSEKKEVLEIDLNNQDVCRLRELAEKVGHYWKHPAPGMMICYEYALMELT